MIKKEIKEILALDIPSGKYYYAMETIRNLIADNTRYGKSLCDAYVLLYKIQKKEVVILERKQKNGK